MCQIMTRLTSGALRYGVPTLRCTIRHTDLDGDLALPSVSGVAGVGAGVPTGSAVRYSSPTSSSTAMGSTPMRTTATSVNAGPTIQVIVVVSHTPPSNLRDVSRPLPPPRERIRADLASTIL